MDLGDTPEDVGACNPAKGEPYFETVIWPMYLDNAGLGSGQCTTAAGGRCHAQVGQSGMRYKTDPLDLKTNYKIAQGFINCGTPEASRMLVKPLAGVEGHSGGDIFPNLNDPSVQLFLDWFEP